MEKATTKIGKTESWQVLSCSSQSWVPFHKHLLKDLIHGGNYICHVIYGVPCAICKTRFFHRLTKGSQRVHMSFNAACVYLSYDNVCRGTKRLGVPPSPLWFRKVVTEYWTEILTFVVHRSWKKIGYIYFIHSSSVPILQLNECTVSLVNCRYYDYMYVEEIKEIFPLREYFRFREQSQVCRNKSAPID